METLEELVYAAAVRRLDKQEHVLGELRATTGILLAASSLTASFLGQRAIVAGRLGVLVVLALVSFAILVAAALYVLAPRQAFAFAVSAARVYEDAVAESLDSVDVVRRLAYELDRVSDGNDRSLARFTRAFRVATLGLGVETALLLAAVSATIF